MKKILILLAFLSIFLSNAHAQKANSTPIVFQSPTTPPLHEMRAVWLTTIGGIDWPHSYAQSKTSIEKQQDELRKILDQLVSAGINTVLLQTRIRATTIFPSEQEPWDGCLSGTPGKSPGYDALAFAIDECHKRGIKLHAWIVTIPIGKWNGAGCRRLRNTSPEIIKKIGDEGFMNPEASGTKDYIASFCRDLTQRYDIDGLHLDYIRYPEAWKTIKDRNKGRENITAIVKAVAKEVKSLKPWVMMSCSPIGKYADTKRAWSHGWNARDIVCQDAALWLKEGYMDCLFPMMYFKDRNFYPFAVDWKERSEGKIITPGLGIYFMSPKEKNWNLIDITREMHVLRQMEMGTCLFRSKFFTDNTKELYDYTKTLYSPLPSLQPAMTWYNTPIPEAPSMVRKRFLSGDTLQLSWNANDTLATNISYNIYGSSKYPVDVTKSENLLASKYSGNVIIIPNPRRIVYYAITSTDRYGNESIATQSDLPRIDANKNCSDITPEAFISLNGNTIDLTNSDVTPGQLIVIKSTSGNCIASTFATNDNERTIASVPTLSPGHYMVYSIHKNKYEHKLGIISKPPHKQKL